MNTPDNNIIAATFILQNIEGELRNRKIGVTYRNITVDAELHHKPHWVHFRILIPIGGSPRDYRLKFIGRHNQYRSRYYGIRDALATQIDGILDRLEAANG